MWTCTNMVQFHDEPYALWRQFHYGLLAIWFQDSRQEWNWRDGPGEGTLERIFRHKRLSGKEFHQKNASFFNHYRREI